MTRNRRPLHKVLKPVTVLKRPKGQYLRFYDDDLDRGEKLYLHEAIDFYWQNKQVSELTRYTGAVYVSTIRSLLGHLVVADLNDDVIGRYRRSRQSGSSQYTCIVTGATKTRPRATDIVLRKELMKLKAAVNFAIRNSLAEPKYKFACQMPAKGSATTKWLAREQGRFLLKAAKQRMKSKGGPGARKTYAFILLAIFTGARRNAIEQLPWSAIDWDRGVIDFRGPGVQSQKKKRAVMVMPVELRDALWELRNDGIGDLQTFVLGDYGSERAYDTVTRFLKSVGFDWVTPHVFRHTFITWALQDGHTPREISDYLHVSEATIRRVYAHNNPYEPSRMSARRLFADEKDQTGAARPNGS